MYPSFQTENPAGKTAGFSISGAFELIRKGFLLEAGMTF
jgi:hypothetical protein